VQDKSRQSHSFAAQQQQKEQPNTILCSAKQQQTEQQQAEQQQAAQHGMQLIKTGLTGSKWIQNGSTKAVESLSPWA
jgi:hypothetical protein